MLKKVIVISPHSDDETLGAGGTILKYKDLGAKVYWLNITNMKEEYGISKDIVLKRQREIERVIGEYKFDDFFDLALKAKYLDDYPMNLIIEKISEVFKKIEPNIVIFPYRYDIHSDHRIVSECTYACTKSFRHVYIEKVLMMEILSETLTSGYEEKVFSPNYFVDISHYLEKKIDIMRFYEGEMSPSPFPRNEQTIKALARYRGSLSGKHFAEAFMLVREVS